MNNELLINQVHHLFVMLYTQKKESESESDLENMMRIDRLEHKILLSI
jgi:hypothetical protein